MSLRIICSATFGSRIISWVSFGQVVAVVSASSCITREPTHSCRCIGFGRSCGCKANNMAVDKVHSYSRDTKHWVLLEKQAFPRRYKVGGGAFYIIFQNNRHV